MSLKVEILISSASTGAILDREKLEASTVINMLVAHYGRDVLTGVGAVETFTVGEVSHTRPADTTKEISAAEAFGATAEGAEAWDAEKAKRAMGETIANDDDGEEVAATGPLDKNGIPWDERIHAETKSQNKDGTWRNKRHVDKDLLAKVTAELLANAKLNISTGEERIDPANAETVVIPPPPPATGTVAPPPPPAATAPAAEGDATFISLMKAITPLQASGKLSPADLKGLLTGVGLSEVKDLMSGTQEQRNNFALLLTAI